MSDELDIVERLRKISLRRSAGFSIKTAASEAADEIERLRTVVAATPPSELGSSEPLGPLYDGTTMDNQQLHGTTRRNQPVVTAGETATSAATPALPGLVAILRSHADDCENDERWATPELAPLLRRAADVIEGGVSPVSRPEPAATPVPDEEGLIHGTYPYPVEHYERVARNLAAVWTNGNRAAEICILSALLKAASHSRPTVCTCEFTSDDLGAPQIKICPACSVSRPMQRVPE